ncbi:PREDICTED: protein SUPPRESSOR OF MAX2 1-like [Nelumbo nucifera]|uniref:Protein SUPPRESSOR OF MAX2 1-like n=1 Tax=Nelumbo nucifera TaxID=4432 RepID=A0A1U7Z4N0_NELNU|nr:PREDICTED: protein SUPPRESSOR OF MAX2 1-like [Nelumbo nucifera]
MRAGLSTIQQTLTPEAASVLNHSIAEAARRNHSQTTPLHVAATLLASPSGYLRQACIRSHPNSSHPLQCRALELCFSVALERLPSAQNLTPGLEPPISNALMAALKRAQAHQRRGCPEQQQQPLLAVKVELEQLIISILDDPSVSRVMREASFSSPAVKATIEQSLNASSSVNSSTIGCGLGFRPAPPTKTTMTAAPNRNLYLNPRLQQGNSPQTGQQRGEDVKRIIDILLRTKKRNPVLVGEAELDTVTRELLQKIEKREVGDGPLRNVQVISLDKEIASDRTKITAKLKELDSLIESRISISNGGSVILDLGDLKWLVEQPVCLGVPGSAAPVQQQIVSEAGRVAVAEMTKLLAKFGEGNCRLWLIGMATCETYLRCQVYHPSMENDWDLQAVPITARTPQPGFFPRLGSNGILSSSVESLAPLKSFPTATTTLQRRPPSENMDPAQRTSCCPQCMENYEQELAKLVAKEVDKSSSEAKPEKPQAPLPQWLQNARANIKDQSETKEQELIWKQKTQELQKKWNDTCSRLHPSFHQNVNPERMAPTPIPMTSLYNPNLLGRQPFLSKLQLTRNLGGSLQMSQCQDPTQPSEPAGTSPGSPVRTDLVLGRPKVTESSPDKTHSERIKDFAGCISSEQDKFSDWKKDKLISLLDADSFKRLLKGLTEKVGWQPEAANAVATTVTQCKSGNGKRRGVGTKGDTWLLFTGPDRVGKKKMASVLSELMSRGSPITIRLGSRSNNDEESEINFRGKTVIDRIMEAVRRNPFSVIVLEDIDQADILIHGSIKRAIERGRLADSHGREVSLGNVIFILTANWLPENLKSLSNCIPSHEEKLANAACNDWKLQLSVVEKTSKRRPDWLHDNERLTKPRKDGCPALSFDLNQAAEAEDDLAQESCNSSDLTVEHEHENGLINKQFTMTSVPKDLLNSIDESIVFKPVDFGPLRSKISSTITSTFKAILGDRQSIEFDDDTLDKIVGGVWFGNTEFEHWAENVLVPSLQQLKASLSSPAVGTNDSILVKLASTRDSENRSAGDWLPNKITVTVEGL